MMCHEETSADPTLPTVVQPLRTRMVTTSHQDRSEAMSGVQESVLEQTENETSAMTKSRHIIACPRWEAMNTLKKLISIKTDECILWPYAKRGNGYGAVAIRRGKVYSTHVVAWALANGRKIPRKKRTGNTVKGLIVCHTCDIRACINPRHLFRGTIKDNLEDMTNKGRRPEGEYHPMAKLSELDVKAIRSIKGIIEGKAIARMFDVTPSVICNILNGKKRKHSRYRPNHFFLP